MIKVPTALIIGAGASKSYGFPLGYELKDQIIRLTTPGSLNNKSIRFVENVLMQKGIANYSDVRDFHNQFKGSNLLSIDKFLSNAYDAKPRYIEIGKHAIAYLIADCENEEKLNSAVVPSDENWYQLLWNELIDNFKNDSQDIIKIVTFNYDRSLEFYLLKALQNSLFITEKEATEKLKKLQIIHVYGDIGSWIKEDDNYAYTEFKSYSPVTEGFEHEVTAHRKEFA